MKITERNLSKFRKDYNKAMELLEAKYGVSIQAGRMTYDDTEFRFKTTVLGSQPKPTVMETSRLRPFFPNERITAGDMVIVNHPKAAGTQFQVVKVNRKRMRLQDIKTNQLFNAPISLIVKV